MVRNEADIIEAFVRVNSLVLDEIYIVDDRSDDMTLRILGQLHMEGLPITVSQSGNQDLHMQSAWMVHQTNFATSKGCDFVVLLDADEFLIESRAKLELELSRLEPGCFGLLPWLSYVPTSLASATEPNFLTARFRPAAHARDPHAKLVIPASLAGPDLAVGRGNHWAPSARTLEESHRLLGTRLGHVPVRTVQQIMRKSLIGSRVLSLKKNRAGEGAHWDRIAEFIRQRNYDLTLQDLQRIAYCYPSAPDIAEVCELLDAPCIPAVGELRYPIAAEPSLVESLDRFAKFLCQQINETRR